MLNNMEENYLAKWLNNELSEEEVAKFKATKEYTSYKKIVDATNSMEAPTFDMAKAKRDLYKRKEANETKVLTLNPYKKYLRIAAVIAVIVGISYFYNAPTNEIVNTQYAERAAVILPDDSEVQLNADSQISYQKKNWKENRNIDLKGEAFFKVAKGERFTVSTDMGMVTVLGTQFNVENREGIFEVSCYEGLVSVLYNQKETKLSAGQSLVVINGQLKTSELANGHQPSWLQDESTFKSIPLKFVLDEFQRQFNMEVETKDLDLEQLFSGSFSNTDKNLALQSISAPSGLKYKIEGEKVLFYAETP
ncbi:iron dicitrate transporter FecR [Arenibacter certesii]|uniref:Iron dicitrate transporter FecR n=2 Tax=Arenibacter certesii TaxID=228955 RepID=A0A918INC3_9FLAO|nr:iron dicitrate transporter FecR [Arenibacter certesii]